jgi:hypothetical protein
MMQRSDLTQQSVWTCFNHSGCQGKNSLHFIHCSYSISANTVYGIWNTVSIYHEMNKSDWEKFKPIISLKNVILVNFVWVTLSILHIHMQQFLQFAVLVHLHKQQQVPKSSHVWPSAGLHFSVRLQMDGGLWNLIVGTVTIICWETPNLVKIRQQCQALYIKT